MADSISYTPTTWADGADGGTPITAARLNNIESGVTNAVKQANTNAADIKTLGDSVSQATCGITFTSNVSGTGNGVVRRGNLVEVSAFGNTNSALGNWGNLEVATLNPAPITTGYFCGFDNSGNLLVFQVGTDGKLLLRTFDTTVASNTPFHVTFCYVCK